MPVTARALELARLAEERRVAIVTTMEHLAELQERLTSTADGIALWTRDPRADGAINPHHAINRLRRMAREIGEAKP